MGDSTRLARAMADECAGHRIRQAARLLTRAYDDSIRPLGIQVSQLFVLTAIGTAGEAGVAMAPLADRLVMDRSTLTRNTKPLVDAGLVRVVRAAADARVRVLQVTPAGEQMIEAAYPAWQAAQRRIRRALGPEAFDALHAQLTAVVDQAGALEDDES